MQSRKTVSIVDIDYRTLPGSGGAKEQYVSSGVSLTLDIGTVGQNTYWSAKTSNIVLANTLTVRKQFYNNEKWCYFDGRVYTVENTAKAQSTAYINLNVSENNDKNIKAVIEKWLTERSVARE